MVLLEGTAEKSWDALSTHSTQLYTAHTPPWQGRGGFQNRGKGRISGTVRRVSNKTLGSIFMEDFSKRLKENFQAKLCEITDALRR